MKFLERIFQDRMARQVLFWAVLSIILSLFLRWPIGIGGDTASYVDAVKFITGEEMEAGFDLDQIKNRMLAAPATLFFISLGKMISGSIYGSMLTMNCLFYLIMAVCFYFLALEILKDKRAAFISSFFVFLNYDPVNFGIAYLTDMGGWMFFILNSFLAVRYFITKEKKYYWLTILFSCFGVLFREYGALGLLNLTGLIFIDNKTKKEKMIEIGKALLLFFAFLSLYHLFFYFKFDYSYFDWYRFNLESYAFNQDSQKYYYSFLIMAKVLGWMFLAGWPMFFFGVKKILEEMQSERNKILLALLPAAISFLVWPVLTQRIAFVFVPWLSIIAGFGLSKIKSNYLVLGWLVFYGLTAYLTDYLMRAINIGL